MTTHEDERHKFDANNIHSHLNISSDPVVGAEPDVDVDFDDNMDNGIGIFIRLHTKIFQFTI